MAGKLPTTDVLLAHRREGMTYEQIGQRYGVTKGGVHLALSRTNQVRREKPDYRDRIPWRVPDKFRNSNMLRMLRAAAAREQGTLDEDSARAKELTKWLKWMDTPEEWAPDGWVVAFDEEKGFHRVPRGSRDEWLIRL